mmetsp:Transcript_9869/g.12175  ORF Transcript_9869/g.12175 Transcript_9869/m.12175 type:complete len:191 (-) Transcript_9869:78-650(-)
MPPTDYDEKFNIILLGDVDVGKTSILLRFSEREFITDFTDVEQKYRDLEIDHKKCRIYLTDTAGQERFRTLTSSFFRNSHAMIFVYDITKNDSFETITGHFEDGSRYTKNAKKYLVGNKTDLLKKRVVTEKQGRELAEKLGVTFFETSAKSGEYVEELFNEIARDLLQACADADTAGNDGKKKKKDCIVS